MRGRGNIVAGEARVRLAPNRLHRRHDRYDSNDRTFLPKRSVLLKSPISASCFSLTVVAVARRLPCYVWSKVSQLWRPQDCAQGSHDSQPKTLWRSIDGDASMKFHN